MYQAVKMILTLWLMGKYKIETKSGPKEFIEQNLSETVKYINYSRLLLIRQVRDLSDAVIYY